MIKSLMEQKFTEVQLQKFKDALEHHNETPQPDHQPDQIWMAYRHALESQIETLEEELRDWVTRVK